MSSRFTKKSFVKRAGSIGEHAVRGSAGVGVEGPQTADEHRHLGRGQRQHVRPLDEQLLGRELLAGLDVVAEPVGDRLEDGEGLDVGLVLRRIGAPRRERHRDVEPGVLGRLLDAGAAAEDDHVGERHLRVAGLRAVEVLLDRPRGSPAPCPVRPGCWPPSPSAGRAGCRAPFAPPRLSVPRNVEAAAQAVETSWATGEPGGQDLGLEGGDVGVADQLVVDLGTGSCQMQLFGTPRRPR